MYPRATSFKSDLTQGSIMKMNIFFHNYANKDMPKYMVGILLSLKF